MDFETAVNVLGHMLFEMGSMDDDEMVSAMAIAAQKLDVTIVPNYYEGQLSEFAIRRGEEASWIVFSGEGPVIVPADVYEDNEECLRVAMEASPKYLN